MKRLWYSTLLLFVPNAWAMKRDWRGDVYESVWLGWWRHSKRGRA